MPFPQARLHRNGISRGVRYRRYLHSIMYKKKIYNIDATEVQNDMAELNDYRTFQQGFVEVPSSLNPKPNAAFINFLYTKGGVARLHTAVVTLQRVAKGEELTLDYTGEVLGVQGRTPDMEHMCAAHCTLHWILRQCNELQVHLLCTASSQHVMLR